MIRRSREPVTLYVYAGEDERICRQGEPGAEALGLAEGAPDGEARGFSPRSCSSLSDFESHVLFKRHAVLLEQILHRALEGRGVVEILVEQNALGEEAVEFSFGDFLGDVLG